jgi:multicomponent Na+:H+ antiporter subunit C
VVVNPADTYANPVPHVLMLTAIVVGVATLGVALALCEMIYKEFDTLEEDELLRKIKALHDDA